MCEEQCKAQSQSNFIRFSVASAATCIKLITLSVYSSRDLGRSCDHFFLEQKGHKQFAKNIEGPLCKITKHLVNESNVCFLDGFISLKRLPLDCLVFFPVDLAEGFRDPVRRTD